MSEKMLTNMDKELQEIAAKDWHSFIKMIGIDAITSAKVCLLRQKDKSYEQIATKLGVSYKQARTACRKCDTKA